MAIFNVKNRGASWVTYKIPEDGIRRSFAPGEVKKVSDVELEKLTYQPGGMVILSQFLQIQDEVALRNLNIRTEPEYHMSEADVAALIRTGSLDAFLDALDFAPVGVIDLIKKLSLEIPLMDLGKRKALKEYLWCTLLRKDSTGASNCIGCGKCETHCPQQIEIRKELQNAKKELEGPVYKLAKFVVAKFMKY